MWCHYTPADSCDDIRGEPHCKGWGRMFLQSCRLNTWPLYQEMASDELKEIRKAMTKEAIREHQMARTGGTQTDLFTCSKCRKKNCTYTQVGVHSIFLGWDLRAHPSSSWIPLMSLFLLVWGSAAGLGGLALPSMERQECSILFGSGYGTFRPCYGGGG